MLKTLFLLILTLLALPKAKADHEIGELLLYGLIHGGYKSFTKVNSTMSYQQRDNWRLRSNGDILLPFIELQTQSDIHGEILAGFEIGYGPMAFNWVSNRQYSYKYRMSFTQNSQLDFDFILTDPKHPTYAERFVFSMPLQIKFFDHTTVKLSPYWGEEYFKMEASVIVPIKPFFITIGIFEEKLEDHYYYNEPARYNQSAYAGLIWVL